MNTSSQEMTLHPKSRHHVVLMAVGLSLARVYYYKLEN